MSPKNWNWKSKNGTHGGLLYESGNWGDILKMLWLAEINRLKQHDGRAVNYTDPFAGDVHYQPGKKAAFRLAQCSLPQIDFLQNMFLKNNLWPSAASGALLLADGTTEVWDADQGRRSAWRDAGVPVAELAEGESSGWDIVARAAPDPDGVLLVDPYDFLAEWEERLPLLVEKSESVSVLLYLYNRSGKNKETFARYRRFRGQLDDRTEQRDKRIGRVAADSFLPDAHHEMIFLPCGADAERSGFGTLLDRLGDCAFRLREAQSRAGVFDC
jgi:hypothetical protein